MKDYFILTAQENPRENILSSFWSSSARGAAATYSARGIILSI